MTDPLIPLLDSRPGPAEPIGPARSKLLVKNVMARAAKSARAPQSTTGGLRLVLIGGGALIVGVIVAVLATAPRASPSVTATPRVVAESTARPAPSPAPTTEDIRAVSVEDLAPVTKATSAPPAGPPPQDLLRVANGLRAERNWSKAAATYERVRVYRGTDEAYTATVAAASIHLDHLGDPKGALALYRDAIAQHDRGPLDEEARYGVAESARAAGDEETEQDALRVFLSRYPDGALAPNARARLKMLGAR